MSEKPMTPPAGIDLRDRFRGLHHDGLFVMPNAWDIGSAKLLAWLGFPAIATTSSGHAAALGRPDQSVKRDELLIHVAALVAAVDIPINVDAERCFADDPAGVAAHHRAHRRCGCGGLLDRGLRSARWLDRTD